jgi:predicted RNA binding protein YcfA (HicA-like mRNA interferase family)
MTSLKSQKIIHSLTKKGFKRSESDHTFLVLYVDGRKSSMMTKVSHGGKDIGDPLINKMSMQVHLNKKNFIDLVNCPLRYEVYMKKLAEEKIDL